MAKIGEVGEGWMLCKMDLMLIIISVWGHGFHPPHLLLLLLGIRVRDKGDGVRVIGINRWQGGEKLPREFGGKGGGALHDSSSHTSWFAATVAFLIFSYNCITKFILVIGK